MYLKFDKNIDHSNLVLAFLLEFTGVGIFKSHRAPRQTFQIALRQNLFLPPPYYFPIAVVITTNLVA